MPEGFLDRMTRRVAARDPAGRWKPFVLAAAGCRRLLAGDLSGARLLLRSAAGRRGRLRAEEAARAQVPAASAVKLIEYTFPGWDDTICEVSWGAPKLCEALTRRGYQRCESISLTEDSLGQETHSGIPKNRAEMQKTYSRVALFNVLEFLPPAELDVFLSLLSRAADGYVAASISVYPDCLFETPPHPAAAFEHRGWWEQAFRRHGFEPLTPPREELPGVTPFLFQKRERVERPARPAPDAKKTQQRPRALFILPEKQNAFRWVAEALCEALEKESFPCPLMNAEPARAFAPRRESLPAVTWAHFWPEHRRIRPPGGPHYEYFVTNFLMYPRNGLSDWIEELCKRPSVKLAPSRFSKQVLTALGVPSEQIRIVPHGYSPEFVAPVDPLPLPARKTFRLLAVVNSYDPYRYGLDLLLPAYRKAFDERDDVCLVIKDYGGAPAAVETMVRHEGGPETLYYANFLPKRQLAAFYRAASCLVAPFRGEGFGMKILDGAIAGLPLILPLFGGPADYCPEQLVQAVGYRRRPVGECLETQQTEWKEELVWCEPEVDDLARQMRWVYEHQDEAKRKAAELREKLLPEYSWQAAARALIRVLEG